MGEVAYLTIPNTEATVYSGQFFADGDAKSTQHGTIRGTSNYSSFLNVFFFKVRDKSSVVIPTWTTNSNVMILYILFIALGPDFRVGVTAITPTGGNTPLATRMVTGFYLTYNQVAC